MHINVHSARFAAAFTDAVINYLGSEMPQQVYFDQDADEFKSSPLDPGTTPEDVDLYVGEQWEKLVSGMSAPQGDSISLDHFRSESIKAITNSADAEKWVAWLTGGARRANEAA